MHARDVADPWRQVTDAYEEAFQVFIKTLEEHEYKRDWVDDPESPITKAYRAFRKAARKEVTVFELDDY